MEWKVGNVVQSKAGRDTGSFFVIVGLEDRAVLLCDGKERPLERPKRKNLRHVAGTGAVLSADQMATNRALRNALAAFRREQI